MAKYDIFKNRRNRHHPSIEIKTDSQKNWLNYEITDSPVAGETYQKLNKNPNRLVDPKQPAFVRKYLRKDKLKHRGQKLNHYELYPEDKTVIDNMLSERNENLEKQKNGVKRLNHTNGNQATRHNRAASPFVSIKTHRKRKRKK